LLATYTFWDGIWTIIVFFAWLMFFTWVVILLMDNFRRRDHGGWAKAGWAVFIIFFPLIGALTYTIVRPESASDYGYEPGFNTGGAPHLGGGRAGPVERSPDPGRDHQRRVRAAQAADHRRLLTK
jgi:hypothetical protein